MDVQTDAYLEELTDVVPEVDTQTQTDAFLDRPPTPLFVPQKTGVDAVTQIENGEQACPSPSDPSTATHVGPISLIWTRPSQQTANNRHTVAAA